MTDVVNNKITDTPEHKEVVFLFKCNFTLEDKGNVEFLLRTNIYPTVEYAKLDL